MNKHRITPLLMAICMVLGVVIGTFYTSHYSGNRLNIINTGSNKLNYLLQLIDNNYVDTVDMTSLVEDAMPQILSELDPHSKYISAKNAEEANENLKGSFSGIGVSFTMEKDTVNVISVIHGGPAEKVGILAGDRIVTADKTSLVSMDKNDVMKHLKGEKGTKVKLGVKRHGSRQLKYFTVVRGDIPVISVDASYMINDNTGYLHVESFGEQTYAEMLVALANLNMSGMKNLIVDLRGNSGGYMFTAIQMVNEFLSKNQLVVYTEGRKSPREEYRSDGRGTFQQLPLVVLVDEGSASASEIFAGAIQDNDRGTIIGRRSFGKGLVQKPMEFSDHSMIRLTIARYYTPSGRCIQKPYSDGKNYDDDWLSRYQHGEFFSQDSIKHTGPAYHTSNGRTVYGGGGITPDIFIPEDTVDVTSYYKEASMSGLILQYAFEYTDENRQKLSGMKDVKEMEKYLKSQNTVERFATYAEKNGLKRRNLMIQKSHKLLERFINSRIIYNILNEQAWTEYLNQDDPSINESLRLFKNGEAFPKAPKPSEPGKRVAYDYRMPHTNTFHLAHA